MLYYFVFIIKTLVVYIKTNYNRYNWKELIECIEAQEEALR